MKEFDAIFKEFTPMVYHFLLSLCGNESLAEELTSETFYQAYLHKVSVNKDTTYSGEVQLWNVDDQNNPITIGYGKIASEKRSFTFSNLSSAHRYMITYDGNEELILTITDGRNISFFGSMKNVFNMILETILF